ncbi:MAG: hypothetical protein AABY95_10300 [Pseudomonadota bacterium]
MVLAIWLSDGAQMATQVALAAPVGVWATLCYLLVVGYTSVHGRWYVAIPLGWLVYLSTAVLLDKAGLAYSLTLGLAILPGLWLAATRWLPKPSASPVAVHLPKIELLARIIAAVVLVLALTTAADFLGPSLTGVLAGVPVAATVIPAFTLANAGRDALLLALRGFLTGLTGFVVFFLVLGHAMPALGALALLPALVACVTVGLAATHAARRVAAKMPS